MWSFLRAALDRLVRNEPGVAAAAPIDPPRVPPARNIAFVLIRNAEREPIQLNAPIGREMKNVFMAIVKESLGTDRLKMAKRPHGALSIFDRDRFGPVNRVL